MLALFLAMALTIAPAPTGLAGSAAIKDAESAAHGDEAASYQIVNTYQYPGFRLVQFNLGVLSHYSYMLISGDQAMVVDPGRDVFAYHDHAAKEGVKITGVFLTHNHADFVAGHMELAKVAGCPISASAKSGGGFPFKPLKEGSQLEIGEAVITVLETPGHTPESICGLVANRAKPEAPHLILTGDTLFVGSVGRPDLMGGSVAASALASMMFDSWTTKLSKLPDSVAIFPAHGAGSLCGAHLSDEPTSTLGAQKTANPYFKHKSRGDFIAAVLEGLPEAPQYFRHNAALNKKGPEPVDWAAAPVLKNPGKELISPSQFYVVDLRDAGAYAAGHIPNAVNIGLRGRLETWVGTMVPWGAKLVVYGSPEEIKEALYRLHRVGYRGEGVTPEAWRQAGLPLAKSELIKPGDLYARMQTSESPVVVDVRLPNEWMGLRIGQVVNIPLNRLAEMAPLKLDHELPVVTVCNSAYRSSMAVGILERQGFTGAASLDGGSEAWIEAGLPTFGPEANETTLPAAAAPKPKAMRDLRLPERISPEAMKRLILDLPDTFELVDIRPAEAFADYHIPGSKNADIAEVMNNPAYLAGSAPLILADRDGSLAMAVGGILSQKTQRPIKVLHGGVDAYWTDLELKAAVRETPLPSGFGKMPLAPPAAGPAPDPTTSFPAAPAAPAPPAPPKKKSAGC
jgi:glyoxylase-like metal-dependent hydrolase (beta-lactamase superfamily II)/rhodanese-related sulfurtransferase